MFRQDFSLGSITFHDDVEPLIPDNLSADDEIHSPDRKFIEESGDEQEYITSPRVQVT